MSRFDKYVVSISESIIQMTFMDEIKRQKIVFLCVWFFLLEQQFLNTYYIICPYVEDTGGLPNYQTHRQRRYNTCMYKGEIQKEKNWNYEY